MDQALEIFPWNDNFSTGIEAVDSQHRNLVKLLNTLVGHLAFQSDAPSVDAVFEELKAYSEFHFRYEEQIWCECFKKDLWEEGHKTAHGDFIKQILDLKNNQANKPIDRVVEEIASFLTHWLALHIIESDKRMAKVVLATRSGMSLEQAKERANLEMSGATGVLIDTVMGMYDNLAHRTIQLTREISSRIRSEAALQQTQAELLRLKESAESGQRRSLKEISRFADILAHHLQEPVRLQMVYTSRLRDALGDHAGPEAREALAMVMQGGERLRLLLRDMEVHLALTNVPWRPRRCDIARILGETVQNLAGEIGAKKAVLHCGAMPTARVDPALLADIFSALIKNALMFSHDDEPPVIRIGVETAPHSTDLVFFVQDNGIGIPADMRERAFNIFEKVHPHRRSLGTGVGLAVVRKIVESAEGRVWIDEPECGGTIVRFSLPA